MANPQKENGFTPIANEILEALVRSNLNGTELACVLFVIRKTYGFNKKEDQLGIQQFLKFIPVSRQTIITALNRLRLVRILILVKKGRCKKVCSVYRFNKNYEEWQLVKKSRLVKKSSATGKDSHKKLVKKSVPNKRHITKEKERKKERMCKASFDTFWKEYPVKKNKKGAREKFMRLKVELLPILLDALKKQKLTAQWKRGIIPHPATWINQERWNDEISETNNNDWL